MLLLLSNNINKHSPWMLSLEIFWSACAAAGDYRQIRCRPSMPAAASLDIFNEYNNTSQFCTRHKISCSIFFYIFHLLYMLKANGTELIDESADVCLHFSGHVTSPAFGRVYLVFVGIRAAHTSFSPFTLACTPCFAEFGSCPPVFTFDWLLYPICYLLVSLIGCSV